MPKIVGFVVALTLFSAALAANAATAPYPLPVAGLTSAQDRTHCVYANVVYPAGYVLTKQNLRCHAGTKASQNFAFWVSAETKETSAR
jgi:hypothetical protein